MRFPVWASVMLTLVACSAPADRAALLKKYTALITNENGAPRDREHGRAIFAKTCQQCHMPVSDSKWFVFPEQGGLVRDYAELHNHTMPGATDQRLLQNTVTMTADGKRVGDNVQVTVNITNDQAGHDGRSGHAGLP